MEPQRQAEFLGTADAAVFLGISESYLTKMRSGFAVDPGPSVVRIGRKCLYPVTGLREWMAAHAQGGGR